MCLQGMLDCVLWMKPDRDKNIQKNSFFFPIERVLISFLSVSHDFIDFLSGIAYNKNNLNKRRI